MDRRYGKKMRRLWKQALRVGKGRIDTLDFEKPFDMWHAHLDWKSKGNRYTESRRGAAKITYELLKHTEKVSAQWAASLEIFATICEDTGNNAVYIHSIRSNEGTVRTALDNVDWRAFVPTMLDGIIDKSTHEIGLMRYSDESVHVLRAKSRSQPG